MANVLIQESNLRDIADAIREKNGSLTAYKPREMAPAIRALPTGGGGSNNVIADWDFTRSLTDSVSGKLTVLAGGALRDSTGLHLTGAQQYAQLDEGNSIFLPDRTYIFNISSMDLQGDDTYHYTLLTFGTTNNYYGFLYRATTGLQAWAFYMHGGWSDPVSSIGTKNYWNGKELGIYMSDNYTLLIYENGSLIATRPYGVNNVMVPLSIGNSRVIADGGQAYNSTFTRIRITRGNYYA